MCMMSYHRVRAEKGQVTSYQQTTVIGVTAPCGKPWHYTANQLAPVDVIVLRTSCAQGVQLKDATSRNSFFQLVCINEATCLPTFMLSCFFSLGFRCTSFILLFYWLDKWIVRGREAQQSDVLLPFEKRCTFWSFSIATTGPNKMLCNWHPMW